MGDLLLAFIGGPWIERFWMNGQQLLPNPVTSALSHGPAFNDGLTSGQEQLPLSGGLRRFQDPDTFVQHHVRPLGPSADSLVQVTLGTLQANGRLLKSEGRNG